MEEIKKLLGRKIRKIRLERKLSQAELAERLSVSSEHMSRIESGVSGPSLALLEEMSRVLSVRVSDFFLWNREEHMGRAMALLEETLAKLPKGEAAQIARELEKVILSFRECLQMLIRKRETRGSLAAEERVLFETRKSGRKSKKKPG
ncbi:MAG: helix-turn-helix transcriptional regulator [Armatimonadetes bacterium]|nr:helix-turn-helix transcriptional regulator [Armatimonadota bacterium]